MQHFKKHLSDRTAYPMNSKKRAIASHQMDVGVCLLLVHLSEAGEELMEVLRGCRIAVSRFGPVYEGHADGGCFVKRLERSSTTLWSSLFAKKWKVFSAFQRSIQTVKAQSQIRPRPLRVSYTIQQQRRRRF